MDFGPGDIGPYDPYMTFALENMGRMTKPGPSEGEVRPEIFQIYIFHILQINVVFTKGHVGTFTILV